MDFVFSIEAVFFSLIGQGVEIIPRTIYLKILLLSICVTGAIVYWSYCAGLVSTLTVENYEFPIKEFPVRIIQLHFFNLNNNCNFFKFMSCQLVFTVHITFNFENKHNIVKNHPTDYGKYLWLLQSSNYIFLQTVSKCKQYTFLLIL